MSLTITATMKLVIVFLFSVVNGNNQVEYLVNLIEEAQKNTKTYVWPTSAKEYCSENKLEKYGTFDFVVIGSGSAGSVVTNRLSERQKWNVLLLEAGGNGNNLTDIPAMMGPTQMSQFNWAFNSTPQITACQGMSNKICFFPRGKGLGGTTLINGLIYARGHKTDFNKWGKLVGNKRWRYKNVLKYFKKSENFVHRNPDAPYKHSFHGKNGPLRVEYELPVTPQLKAFLEANKELGYDIVDYNANRIGASPEQINTINGKRLDNAKAFLTSIKNRSNLKILTESYVTKIRLDQDKKIATGVEFSHQGKNYFVEVTKEVILCAGAIGSPQVLMLSGIGPKSHLEKLNISVVADLKVGSTFRDHPTYHGLSIHSDKNPPVKPLKTYVEEYLQGIGPLTFTTGTEGIGMYESSYSKGTGVPDIELMLFTTNCTSPLVQIVSGLTKETYDALYGNTNPAEIFQIYVIALHTKSFGTVRLQSNNPYDYPIIDPNFISDPEDHDINIMYEGIQLALKLLNTEAFKSINATLQAKPLKACKQHKYFSKDYWYCALRQLTADVFHPQGTCPMGTDPKLGAVVDSNLKVFGFNNLRVADASVLPMTIAGHPNAPLVMIGEQLADLVKEAHKFPWSRFKTMTEKLINIL